MRFYTPKGQAIYLDVEEHEDKIIMTFHSDHLAQDFRFEIDGLTASEISHQLNKLYMKQVLTKVAKTIEEANKAMQIFGKKYLETVQNSMNEVGK